jgi:transcriptional regulator of arginine metabolism
MQMNKYSSTQRRATILEIIEEKQILSQEELAQALRKKGVDVTQPTLSRDMRELGLAKSAAGYVAPGAAAASSSYISRETLEHRLAAAVREYAASIEAAGNLVVLRTPPAGAQPLAHALDEAEIDGVAGSIAGDDTIFLAVSTASAARALVRRLRNMTVARPARRRRA